MELAQVFSFEGKVIRVVMVEDEPWWVASDVCSILQIDPSLSVNGRTRKNPLTGENYLSGGLDDDEKGTVTVNTLGGNQKMLAVNEAGLYSLIFKSKKSEAKQFKRWVTHEVIPSIRKTGTYSVAQQPQIPQTYKEALVALLEKVEENERLENENKMMLPKAQTYDRFIEREESLRNIGVVAKELGDHWGEKRLYHFLRAMGVLFKQSGSNVPKQQYMKYFEVKETVKNNINCAVTLVKPEGHEFIMRLVEEFEGYLDGGKVTYNSIDEYVKIKVS